MNIQQKLMNLFMFTVLSLMALPQREAHELSFTANKRAPNIP
jgi:hypothetical protein